MSPEAILRDRKAVCSGYSNLYLALATRAGLEARYISGYAKGYGYKPGETPPSHAWNAVRLEGEWHVMDVTWAAGGITSEGEFVRQFKERWFLPPPEEFLKSHLAHSAEWQLVANPITLQQFESTSR